MSEAGHKTLQKSYSFDNVSFSALTTADPKDVGSVQKSIQTLSSEMTADLAKFTADELAATGHANVHTIGGANLASELDAVRAIDEATRLACRI